jgi:cytochrome c oxidase assembly factor CtaG
VLSLIATAFMGFGCPVRKRKVKRAEERKQLGGLIMWIPAGLVYTIAGLALFAGWLRESELRSLKRPLSSDVGREWSQ